MLNRCREPGLTESLLAGPIVAIRCVAPAGLGSIGGALGALGLGGLAVSMQAWVEVGLGLRDPRYPAEVFQRLGKLLAAADVPAATRHGGGYGPCRAWST